MRGGGSGADEPTAGTERKPGQTGKPWTSNAVERGVSPRPALSGLECGAPLRRRWGWCPQLEDALTALLARQKQVVVGRNYTAESRLSTPLSSVAIAGLIERTSGKMDERMLEQELLLA